MGYNDDLKYGVDKNGKRTITAIDRKDHKGMGPHAHDIDITKPFSDLNSARGKARPLTKDEEKEYIGNKK